MGIIHRKKKEEPDNFTLIAQNVAAIFSSIQGTWLQDAYEPGDIPEEILFAIAVLDMKAYLDSGTVTLEDIADIIKFARAGMVSINFYSIRPYGLFDYVENREVVFLAMQIVASIIWLESSLGTFGVNITYREVVDLVVSEKEKIAQAVNETLAHPTSIPGFSVLDQFVHASVNDKDFIAIIGSYNDLIS